MAETPLTDSIEALTTYANQVTGASDTNLSDAVYTLAQGYGGGGSGFNPLQYAYSCYRLLRGSALPDTIYLDFTGNSTIDSMSEACAFVTGVTKITIKGLSLINKTMNSCFYGNSNSRLTTVEFIDCDIAPSNMESLFRACANLTDIIGEIDFSNATTIFTFFDSSTKIKEFRAKQNSISINIGDSARFNRPTAFSDDTLVSIANGLNPNVSGNTIDLHANMVTRCGTLMGVNNNGTFVADISGTLSLADFITTVKGWTLS